MEDLEQVIDKHPDDDPHERICEPESVHDQLLCHREGDDDVKRPGDCYGHHFRLQREDRCQRTRQFIDVTHQITVYKDVQQKYHRKKNSQDLVSHPKALTECTPYPRNEIRFLKGMLIRRVLEMLGESYPVVENTEARLHNADAQPHQKEVESLMSCQQCDIWALSDEVNII